tara:strand:- start:5047 stop:6597 length:1551 start_codon:yes stop_codon:yes gene_type:complete
MLSQSLFPSRWNPKRMNPVMKKLLLTLLFLSTQELPPISADVHHYHFENVLGTFVELQIESDKSSNAQNIKDNVLSEIDRLASILSHYDPATEINRWQLGQIPGSALSPELKTVLERAEYWRDQTSGAFEVRIEHLSQLWRQAEVNGQIPSAEERHQLLSTFSDAPYQLDAAENKPLVTISLDGLAKGYILDQVCESVRRKHPTINNFLINIGGDIRKLGDSTWRIDIENPFAPYKKAFTQIELKKPWSVATSGNYRRGFKIDNKLHSHIIDPRTGLPSTHISSASVLAPMGMDADALATAFSVLPVSQSIRLAESQKNTECLLILNDGTVITSSGWPGGNPNKGATSNINLLEPTTNTGLRVSFSLNRPEGGRYRRPYVAIWLEDKDGFPVKTALLWLQVEQPGPRWHRDLTRWYRNDRSRRLVENVDLIKTVAGATRGPGKYETHFDGTDNSGKPLPSGQYTLCIEVAREHGTYQIIRKSIKLGTDSIQRTKISGNIEVGEVSFEYTPPTSRAN